ncbi:MAG: hypothetical protein KGK15_19130, partial [Burkholderiales bacterium]|nr:hypothetical protein [Burkholderiales bacterium]
SVAWGAGDKGAGADLAAGSGRLAGTIFGTGLGWALGLAGAGAAGVIEGEAGAGRGAIGNNVAVIAGVVIVAGAGAGSGKWSSNSSAPACSRATAAKMRMARDDIVRLRGVRPRQGGSGRLDMSAHLTTAPATGMADAAQAGQPYQRRNRKKEMHSVATKPMSNSIPVSHKVSTELLAGRGRARCIAMPSLAGCPVTQHRQPELRWTAARELLAARESMWAVVPIGP